MNWIFLNQVLPAAIDYGADLGLLAVAVYTVFLVPILFGAPETDARGPSRAPSIGALAAPAKDLDRLPT